jgi:hypothetical protein
VGPTPKVKAHKVGMGCIPISFSLSSTSEPLSVPFGGALAKEAAPPLDPSPGAMLMGSNPCVERR